jgi:hypothetical protein
MSKIIDEMRGLLGEDSSKDLSKLSDMLDPVIEQTKKLMQGMSGSDKAMLTRLLNAAVEVRKWADGD